MAGFGFSTIGGAAALAFVVLCGGPAPAQPAPEMFVTATPDAPARAAEPEPPAAPLPPSARPLPGRAAPTVTAVVDLRAPAPSGQPVAQIAALGTIAEASQALGRLGDLLTGPLRREIQPAVSGEKIYYRALVAGFAARADAAAFCVAWKRRGGECFVR